MLGLSDSDKIKYHIIDAKEYGITKKEMAAIIEYGSCYNPGCAVAVTLKTVIRKHRMVSIIKSHHMKKYG